MKLYKCEWLDGSVSFVLARSGKDASSKLLEVGAVDADAITVVDEFLVTLAPGVSIDGAGSVVNDGAWAVSELGECMADVLPDHAQSLARQEAMQGVIKEVPPSADTSKCVGCPSYDPIAGACANGSDTGGELSSPYRLTSLGDMPIPPEEREGLRLVLENLCHQIVNGNLPSANLLVAVIHTNHPAGARGAVLHRNTIEEKGGTTTFPVPFIQGALLLPVKTPDSLLTLVETSNGIGSFVVDARSIDRTREQPAFFAAPGSTMVN